MTFITTNASKYMCQLWQEWPCSSASQGQADPAYAVVITSHCESPISWSCRHWLRICRLVNRQERHTQTGSESCVTLSLVYKSMKWPCAGSIKVSWRNRSSIHWHWASTDSFIPKIQVTQLNSKVVFHSTPLHCISLPPVDNNKQKCTTMHQPA